MDRRFFIGIAGAGAALGALGPLCTAGARPAEALRPPGASPDFARLCIRCGRCGPVCPTRAVRFSDTFGPDGGTPYIVAAERACILCMKCTAACPTGALAKTPADRDVVLARVRMGVAHVDEARCWGHHEREICRACWYACPYPDVALVLDADLGPRVVEERCVGCGLCAEACPEEASAVRVKPA